jgi:hypothetical protein
MEMSSLFHRKRTTDLTNFTAKNAWIWCALVIWITWAAGISLAQEPLQTPVDDQDKKGYSTQDLLQSNQGEEQQPSSDENESKEQEPSTTPPDSQGQEGYSTHDLLQSGQEKEDSESGNASQAGVQEPIPVPIDEEEGTKSLAGQTMVDDVFQSTRNHWGFSLNAYQAYTTDVSRIIGERRDASITAFIGRTFFNVGKRKSRFHLDLGAGYRFYNRHEDLNSWDYYGDTQYSYLLSKRASFQVSDQFTSSYNDAWSFISLYSPLHYNMNFSNEVLFNRQRITRNALSAELAFQLTRKARVGIFGGYNYYDYPQYSQRNAHAFEAGGDFNYQLTKWLYFSSRYSTYLNYVDDRYRDAQIHRLQIGGFDFHLSHSWRLWAGGGLEYTDYQNDRRVGESANAGIGYTTRNTMLNLTYQRGFTSAIGISRLMQSDIASAEFGRRITQRIGVRLQSYYYRSTDQYYGGLLETFSGGGGLEFSLSRALFMNMDCFYQNQRSHDFSIEGLGLNRLTAYVGLQYVWPSRRRGDYLQLSSDRQ